MKRSMKLDEFKPNKPDQATLVKVMGRVDPDLFQKARPVMKKNGITWNSLIEGGLKLILEAERKSK